MVYLSEKLVLSLTSQSVVALESRANYEPSGFHAWVCISIRSIVKSTV